MAVRSSSCLGFSLLEMMISLAVLGILLVSVFSITVETSGLVADTDTDHSTQNEANQAFSRMTEVLRKCGRNSPGGLNYPRVQAGGKRLEFRMLEDLDGNGYPFDTLSGDLEWGPKVYEIRADGSGNLRVYDGTAPVWHLCRYVEDISFETYLENPALQLKEIFVSVKTKKLTRRGEPIECTVTGSINMRN